MKRIAIALVASLALLAACSEQAPTAADKAAEAAKAAAEATQLAAEQAKETAEKAAEAMKEAAERRSRSDHRGRAERRRRREGGSGRSGRCDGHGGRQDQGDGRRGRRRDQGSRSRCCGCHQEGSGRRRRRHRGSRHALTTANESSKAAAGSNMQDYEKLGAFYLGRRFDLPANRVAADEPLLYDAKDLCTHAVIVGMTGSGKTGLAIDAARRSRDRRHPGDRDRPEGRSRQPAAHLSRARRRLVRALDRPGRGGAPRQHAGGRSAGGRSALARRSRGVGPAARAHRALRRLGGSRDLHAGIERRAAARAAALARRAAGRARRRRRRAARARAEHDLRPARPGRRRRRSAAQPRAHPRRDAARSRLARRPEPRSRRSDRADPEAARRTRRRARPRVVLPGEGAHAARARGEQSRRLAELRRRGPKAIRSMPRGCSTRRRESRASRSSRSRISRTRSACSS